VAPDPVSVAVPSNADVFQEEFDAAGLNVIVEGLAQDEMIAALEEGPPSAPDVAFLYQPNDVGELAAAGRVVSLREFGLVQPSLDQRFGAYLAGLGSVDGTPYAVSASVGLKSLVWYPPDDFRDVGYQVPVTWDEMMTLSQQIADTGDAAWCMAMGSPDPFGDATGWVGTDWIEDILLRTAGTDVYDAWTRGDLPFSSPEVTRAWEIYGQVLFTEGFVLESPEEILSAPWWEALGPLLWDPPGCWMHRQASFAAQTVTDQGGVLGQNVAVFGFPTIDPDLPRAGLIGAELAVVSHVPNNPRERSDLGRVVRFIASPQFGTHALAALPGWISAHQRFNDTWYTDEVKVLAAQYVDAARHDDGLRFDGSDLMPEPVNLAFFAGIRDYITADRDLDTILARRATDPTDRWSPPPSVRSRSPHRRRVTAHGRHDCGPGPWHATREVAVGPPLGGRALSRARGGAMLTW
jgi:alpha-glucoside transport system substrate-binding protein